MECFCHFQAFRSLFQWQFRSALYALGFPFATVAIFCRVAGLDARIAGLALYYLRARNREFPAIGTKISVFVAEIGHVLETPDVILPSAGLCSLVVVRLDVGRLPIRLEIDVVLFAFITGVGDDLGIALLRMRMKIFQERDERRRICRLRSNRCPCDEFCIHAALNVVGRLQLSVSHRIFFHPHEGRIGIRLGEAVARSHDAELFLVIFPARDELVQFLQRLLQHAFAPSAPMNEDEALFLLQTFQLLAHLLEVAQAEILAMSDGYGQLLFCLLDEGGQLFQKFRLIFQDGLLPDKLVFVGDRLDLGSVDEDVLKRYDTERLQKDVHLCEQILDARCQVLGAKARDGRMIGRGLSFQKIKEVHIASASRLNSSRAEEMAHARIDENGEQLPGGRQPFVDTSIGAIERG